MSKKEKLKRLYNNGLELHGQLNALETSTKFMTSKELGSFYLVKSSVQAQCEENDAEFEKTVNELKDD